MPDLTLVTLVVPMLAGLAAGFVNAVAGGGSLILFPALLWVGYPAVTANVTNAVSLWPGYLSGTVAMRRDLAGLRATARPLVVASGLAAIGGSLALLLLPSEYFTLVVPFLVLFASLLLLFQPALAARSLKAQSADGTRPPAAWLMPAIIAAGVYGGYFGGVVGVLLMAIIGLSGAAAGAGIPALKNLLQFSINTVALVIFLFSGKVAWLAVAVVAPMTLLGGWLGGKMASRMDPEVLRWSVAIFGLGVSGYLFLA